MDWRNRRYYLIKGIHSFDQERQILNLKQKAKVTIHTRPARPDINNTIYWKCKTYNKDEHIPRNFYNYMIGCNESEHKIVLDYLEKCKFKYKELKEYKKNKMVTKYSWEEFRENGLLLFVNQILHIFGWAICFNFNQDGNLQEVYPARVRYRGFSAIAVSQAYTKLSKFMKDNADDLYIESRE